MLSFNNDPSLKAAILAGIEAHEAADEIIHGTYWEGGKGCAVGCTLNAFAFAKGRSISKSEHGDHSVYDEILGEGGQIIAKLEDRIFEGMSNGSAKAWPARLMRAVPVGRSLAMVWPRFALWLLTEELSPKTAKHPKCAAALADVAALYREWRGGDKPSKGRWLGARRAAYAAYAAAAAAADAAYAAPAAAAAAADAAAYAAPAAAADAAYAAPAAAAAAADAAAYAAAAAYADAAAYAADAADAAAAAAADAAAYAAPAAAAYAADAAAADAAAADAAAADAAARQAFYRRMADKLIEILSEI